MSYHIEEMIVDASYINELTLCMFFLILIYSTQDIAVDGWSVELLHPDNKSLASACQSTGQTIGFFFSFTGLLILNSKDFCNAYIFNEPQPAGLLSVSFYLVFMSIFKI